MIQPEESTPKEIISIVKKNHLKEYLKNQELGDNVAILHLPISKNKIDHNKSNAILSEYKAFPGWHEFPYPMKTKGTAPFYELPLMRRTPKLLKHLKSVASHTVLIFPNSYYRSEIYLILANLLAYNIDNIHIIQLED